MKQVSEFDFVLRTEEKKQNIDMVSLKDIDSTEGRTISKFTSLKK